MSDCNMLRAAHRSLECLGNVLQGSLVYLDAGAAEAIQTSIGLKSLIDRGVANVCDLQKPNPQDIAAARLLSGGTVGKVVVFTTQLLKDTRTDVLGMLKVNTQASECTIFCSISEPAHGMQPEAQLGVDAYAEYKEVLREDVTGLRARHAAELGEPSLKLQLSIEYFPLHACALSNSSFVLPAQSAAACLARVNSAPAGFSVGGEHAGGKGESGDDIRLAGLRLLSHSLVGLAAQLGYRVDTFALGPIAQMLGAEVASVAPPAFQDGRAPTETAALVLVDRSLDLVTPVCHSDHLLDRIAGLLPRHGQRDSAQNLADAPPSTLAWRPADSEILVGNRAGTAGDLEETPSVSGSTCHPSSESWQEHLRFLLASKKGSDAAMFLRKWLREAARKEGVVPAHMRFKTGSVPPAELQVLYEALAGSPGALLRHGSVMQLATAAFEALSGPSAATWDTMARQEKQLQLTSLEGNASLAAEVVEVLRVVARSSPEANLNLSAALQLVVAAFSLSGDSHGYGEGFSPTDTRQMKDGLVEACMAYSGQSEDGGTLRWLGDLEPRLAQRHLSQPSPADSPDHHNYEGRSLALALADKVDELFMRLRTLAAGRSGLKEFQSLVHAGSGGDGSGAITSVSLLRSLAGRILEKQHMQDLVHTPASLQGMIKSKLGQFGFMGQKLANPSDHSTVIIFVVGGVCMREVREVRQAVDENRIGSGNSPVAVILGGTSLLAPSDILYQLA